VAFFVLLQLILPLIFVWALFSMLIHIRRDIAAIRQLLEGETRSGNPPPERV